MRRSPRHPFVASAVVILVASLALAGCAEVATPPIGASPTSQTPSAGEGAEASPSGSPAPTTQNPATASPQPSPTVFGSATVTVVTWGADGRMLRASGIVTGEALDGGICTLTAVSASGEVVAKDRVAEVTPAAVNCGVIEVAAAPGEWTLVLSFRSTHAAGDSAPVEIRQP